MNKIDVLKNINIGTSVAEQEMEGLKEYFLKTYLWEELLGSKVDIIFGCKGSGKSAIYNYLSSYEYELLSKNVILTLAENTRGAVAFKDLNTNPPENEFEFKCIWKLYFILIIAQKLLDANFSDPDFKIVIEKLQDSDLMARRPSFTSTVKMVRDYVRRISPSFEATMGMNEHSGLVDKFGLKVSLLEPAVKHSDKGIISVDSMLHHLNKSLVRQKDSAVWLAIDRLDAIFQENFELEATALRTLFQVYNDLTAYSNIRLIIFLRDDIWNRIIEKGFRETSHIVKKESINWDKNSLFYLLMTRFKRNSQLLQYVGLNKVENKYEMSILFEKIFPLKISNGTKFIFDWLIARIEDGNGNALPRELIEIINIAIKSEIKALNEGIYRDGLISLESIESGLKYASNTKLDTLVAEYPKLKYYIYKLKSSKVRLKFEEIKDAWGISKKDATIISNNLLKLGFFKQETLPDGSLIYLVPVIYRPALKMNYGGV